MTRHLLTSAILLSLLAAAGPLGCSSSSDDEAPETEDSSSDSATDSNTDSTPDLEEDIDDAVEEDVDDTTEVDDDSAEEDTTDVVEVIEDVTPPAHPVVQFVFPAQGANLSVSEANGDRFTIQFDIEVQPTANDGGPAIELSLEETNSSTSYPLAADYYRGFSGTEEPQTDTIELKLTGPSALIAGSYVVRVANIPTPDGGVQQDAETWTFTLYQCGNGTCEAGESSCSCSADCGSCSGCCRNGRDCLPGTADNACGRDGATCQFCAPSGTCFNGNGCLDN